MVSKTPAPQPRAETAAPVATPQESPKLEEPAPVAPLEPAEGDRNANEAPPASGPVETKAADDRPRLYAPAGLVKIFDKPDRDAPVIGALRAGQSVVMKDTKLTPDRQFKREYLCDEGWYPVEPRGFVCVGGGDHAVKDAEDPRVIAARAALPDVASEYPFRYGVSVGAPQYRRIPTAEEQREKEKDLDSYLAQPATADDEKGGTVDATPAGRPPTPAFLKYQESAKPPLVDEKEAYAGMKVAWTQEFDANGRTWLLTPDMTLIPKDKVRQKPLPVLRGIDLKANPEMKLPLAFFWMTDTPKFKMGDDGKLVETDQVFKRHSFVRTSLKQARGPHGIVYWNVDDEYYVPYNSVSIIKKAEYMAPGASAKDKWVEVRVTWGYLIAYEGTEPVYVTAISPGQDGIANAAYATARGKHFIQWKLLSGDMSGRDKGADWYVQEVPWVQYYKDNFAAHGAWWHNDFGRPKSHGCVNISPPDARFLFHWMDPPMPEGWYAVSPYSPVAKSTMINIRP
jgi:lipoprotein-anchoring transpeptidase ErfK/SrfK